MSIRIRFLVAIVGCVCIVSSAAGQNAAPDSAHAWKSSLRFDAAGTQAGSNNWVAGGATSLAGNIGLTGQWDRKTASWAQHYEVRLRYGVAKQDTLDIKKTEDEIFLLASWTSEKEGSTKTVHPIAAVSFRSQFYEGFNYEKNPFEDGRPLPVKVSDLMAPGTFMESIGLTWQPKPWFSQHFGVAGKQTVILIEELRSIYGSKIDEKVRSEIGFDAVSNLDITVAENVQYKSSFGLFAAFNSKENPDSRWDNTVTMQVNGLLRVTFEWVLMFDADVSKKVQFREALGVGISYAIL